MLITDRRAATAPLPEIVAPALRRGVNAVLLREKDLPAREQFALALELREITRAAGAELLISARADIALAAGADGVHLGWDALPPEAVRAVAGTRLKIGVSSHSLEEALAAERAGADYVTFSPIFATPSKNGLVAPQGIERLRKVCAALRIPCIALGGITLENAHETLAAGAAGVAGIRLFATPPKPGARHFLEQLRQR